MNRTTVLTGLPLLLCCLFLQAANGAELAGSYIAQITRSATAPPQYARVSLTAAGTKIGGLWGDFVVDGGVTGSTVTLKLTDKSGKSVGELSGTTGADGLTGEGTLAGPAGNRGGGGGGAAQRVSWKLTAYRPPDKPKVYDFEPKSFYTVYSAKWAPVLRIYPGDTVRTRTIDNAKDADAVRYGTGGNPSTGPFYVEGALPGDTLVVHLLKVRPSRTTAQQGSRINGRAVTPQFMASAQYEEAFNSQWTLDVEKGVARLTSPTERLKGFTIPIKTMLGCVSVAPSGDDQLRGTDLGPFGGNLDYNDNVEGTTLYFPVSHAGALFGIGDAHAAMGDGEVTGSALETSAYVEFSVDVIKGEQTAQTRAETKDYLISFGVSGSVAESIQASTTQLAGWLKKDYGFNDSELAIFLGAVLKYDIAELVDPHINVVAKVPKSALVSFKKLN